MSDTVQITLRRDTALYLRYHDWRSWDYESRFQLDEALDAALDVKPNRKQTPDLLPEEDDRGI